MRMPGIAAGQHRFSEVPRVSIPRSAFDRSFGYKTTFDAGYLVPFYVDEALPGDTFTAQTQVFMRLATPIKPIMDNIHVEFFYFAVPYRLVWNNWERFNGAQDDPGDSTDFVVPIMTAHVPAVHSLSDYMGLPARGASVTANSLHFRAYNLIYNEWFRDQNLQNSVVVDKDDGPDDIADYVLLRRGKRHDYFTSCLPWPQKGDSVSLPLGTAAPVATDVAEAGYMTVFGTVDDLYHRMTTSGADLLMSATDEATTANRMYADLSTATAATINELRQAFQVQRLLEKDARGGTRYTELVKAHFGVTSPDARLQRPEYLGGGRTMVNISPVAQTSESAAPPTSVDAQGNLSGFGTASGRAGFAKSFTEHCLILGLVNVRADLTYQQGLERMWSRSTRYDFYQPTLAHIGEQAVLSKEIFYVAGAGGEVVFGYQERYGEYRYKPSLITGLFRSDAAGSLDVWHLSQDFSAAPTLNAAFIVDDPPIDRVIAVPTEPHFLFDSYTRLKCARPMPLYGVPGLIDHF